MAKVPNAVEILLKFETPEYGARTLQTDRQTTDGRATANSEREREFRFTKNLVKQELVKRWDSERELLYDDNIHVEASAYAH